MSSFESEFIMDNEKPIKIEMEKETYDQYYTVFQDYPEIFEKHKSEHFNVSMPTLMPGSIPTLNVQSFLDSDKLKLTNFSEGPGLNKNIAGITLGLLFAIVLIILSLAVEFENYQIESFFTKIFLFVIVCILFICLVVGSAKSIDVIKNYKKIFNCNVVKYTNQSQLTLNSLNIDPAVISKLQLNSNNPVCAYNKKQNNFFKTNNSNLFEFNYGFIKITPMFHTFLLLIVFFGLFISDNPFQFMLVGKLKFVILFLLMLSVIGLTLAISDITMNNKMTYISKNVQTLKNRIGKLSHTDNRITSLEESNLELILKKNNLTKDAIIVSDVDTVLKPNTFTTNDFDGLLLFVHIVMMALLLFFFISIISQYNYGSSIFNLATNAQSKILYVFLSLFISGIVFLGSIYPWLINDNITKNNKSIAIGLSVSLPSIVIILITVFLTTTNTNNILNN